MHVILIGGAEALNAVGICQSISSNMHGASIEPNITHARLHAHVHLDAHPLQLTLNYSQRRGRRCFLMGTFFAVSVARTIVKQSITEDAKSLRMHAECKAKRVLRMSQVTATNVRVIQCQLFFLSMAICLSQ